MQHTPCFTHGSPAPERVRMPSTKSTVTSDFGSSNGDHRIWLGFGSHPSHPASKSPVPSTFIQIPTPCGGIKYSIKYCEYCG